MARPPKRDREADPPTVGVILGDLVGRRGWAERMQLGKLQMSWAAIVGDHIAARSEPVKLEGGILGVRAAGAAWATELTLLSSSIATKTDGFLGGTGAVREVRITTGAD